MSVTLRYWAAAKDAAGLAEEAFDAPRTVAELLGAAAQRHPDGRLSRVLARCAFLVDGEPVGLRPHDSVCLDPGAVVEALPPFAGG